MRAARLHEYTTDMSDALVIEEVDRPEVTRSDHVLVEVEGAGWCQTDNHAIEGAMTDFTSLPITLGHENAGTVIETGGDVTEVQEGDQVICHPTMTCGTCRACRLGNDMGCENLQFSGLTTDGGFAEYLLTSERAVITLNSINPVDIAPHADAGLAAYHAVKKAIDELVPGDYVVIFGIGGLGHIGLQLVDTLSGAVPIAVDTKDEALRLAEKLGADHTINPTESDVSDEVTSVTDGRMATQVLDFVGEDETLEHGPSILVNGGDHHVVGYGGHVHVPSQALVGGELSFRGSLVGKYTELQELVALAERGGLDLVTTPYELEEINTVAKQLEHGEIEGRAVIVP
jgi:D-arabinose 1-dehydrogenase-like Zn-dependent alcohol dehydrogenase